MINEIATQFSCQNYELVGICHPAEKEMGIVIVTGGPQYRIGSHRQFLLIARALAQACYPVFRFDYRDMGDSCSQADVVTFEYTRFDQTTADIIAAIDEFKHQQPQIKKIVLLGLCDAASAILIAIPYIKANVSGIILINPWVYQEKTIAKTYLKYYYVQKLKQKEFWINLFTFKINFIHSLKSLMHKYHSAFSKTKDAEKSQTSFIEQMFLGLLHYKGKILTLLSEDDLTAREFQLFIKENKTWENKFNQANHSSLILPGTDHTFSNKQSRQQVIDSICQWLKNIAG